MSVEATSCCAGQYMPGEAQCPRAAKEIVLAWPSDDMVAGSPAWQAYPLCGVYHRGEALGAMIAAADPKATVLVFSCNEVLATGAYQVRRQEG